METVYVVLNRDKIICMFSSQEAADAYCTEQFKLYHEADYDVEAWSVEN